MGEERNAQTTAEPATLCLTGGNIMQGAMSLSSLSFMRPVAGYADYRTPIRGLYLCGSGAHPGGGVTGIPGRNAAREIIRDARRLSRDRLERKRGKKAYITRLSLTPVKQFI